MTAAAASDEDTKAIGRINGALRGPVTEIFQQVIPDLRARSRRDAYERIMNSPKMATVCFREFRAKPELFRDLMVGPDAAPVTNDDQMLSCGRTLAQVIALIVRAIAKRYFRARLAIIRKPPQKAASQGLFSVIFGAFKPPPAPRPVRKEFFRADALYHAFRAHLLFEWQVGLIPHYVSLPVSLVTELGPRILDYREVAEIEALARAAKAPGLAPAAGFAIVPAAPDPAAERVSVSYVTPLPPAVPAMPSTSQPAIIDVLRSVSRRFGLVSLFGVDDSTMHRLLDVLHGPGRPILSALGESGLAQPEAIVAAACIIRRVGSTRFEALMASANAKTFIQDLGHQARERDTGSLNSAGDIQTAFNAIVDQVLKNHLRP